MLVKLQKRDKKIYVNGKPLSRYERKFLEQKISALMKDVVYINGELQVKEIMKKTSKKLQKN